MGINTFILIFCSVGLSAFAQISLKHGMSSPYIAAVLIRGELPATIIAILSSPYVIAGLGMYGLGALLWLFVLAKLDVTVAYPFVGLGFIMTMLLGAALLGEQLHSFKVIGTLLVVTGVVMVAR